MRIAVAGATGLIGHQVTSRAEAAGHEVVKLSRSLGVDLTDPDPATLATALAGATAVIDVTRSPLMGRAEASEFFTRVGTNLGRAAATAGVSRTVVLSIVGIDDAQDFDWYAATLAHERAVRAHAPGPVVVRTTQFHEFPAQVLARSRSGDVAKVMDVPTQPVDSAEVARALLDTALDPAAADWQLAGPRAERLVELARIVAADEAPQLRVEPAPTVASVAGGAMLPGPGTVLRGPDWRTWYVGRHSSER
jgi:uncharacterized protein YbjT (DUF2867 family)